MRDNRRTRRTRRGPQFYMSSRQLAEHRRDTILGILLFILSGAILAAPFVWCVMAPDSFRQYVWGF